MMRRMTVAEVAAETNRHEVTVRKALEAAELHGTQSKKGGRWSIREDCAEAWADRIPCDHQKANVTSIKSRRAS